MTYYTVVPTRGGFVAVWPTKGEIYFARLDGQGDPSRQAEIKALGRSGMRTGGLAGENKDQPLFRSTLGTTKRLTCNPLTTNDVGRMMKRRLKDAGLPLRLSPHSLRVTGITDLLEQGMPLEDVQYLAGHAELRTTGLYDRRQKKVKRNLVERLSI